MKKQETYHPTKLKPIIQIAARMIKEDPTLLDDIDAEAKEDQLLRLRNMLKKSIPALADPSHCPNCEASMAEYVEILDVNDALLLFSMARIVAQKMKSGNYFFTEANKLRVSSSDIHHTQKCRTTKCSKLGLIAKAGKYQWSITRRGWEALRGQGVPRVRVTFRGKIIDRPEQYTTLAEVFREHCDKMKARARAGKSIREDKSAVTAMYDPEEWIHFGNNHTGSLL